MLFFFLFFLLCFLSLNEARGLELLPTPWLKFEVGLKLSVGVSDSDFDCVFDCDLRFTITVFGLRFFLQKRQRHCGTVLPGNPD